MGMSVDSFDYLIAGGGTAGCVLASRLSHAGHRVAVFEAGPEDYSAQVMSPLAAPTLHGSPLEYNFSSEEQPQLANRRIPNFGGRLLSGSSAVNYANWTRGHSVDYDAWAALVCDERWSYKGLTPYFSKVENLMRVSTAIARDYPLKEPLRNALTEAGVQYNGNANGGNPLGFAPLTENWKEGQRQPAGKVYDLTKASIFTNAIVSQINVDRNTKVASGLQLLDGRLFTAKKEVLVCTGSIKTPQLLMLSGIGDPDHLASYGIESIVSLPVGSNLHDHLCGTLYWRLRFPEQGLAIGSERFSERAPQFRDGNPIDWIVTHSVHDSKKVERQDSFTLKDSTSQPRGHVEFFISYAPIAAPAFFDYSLAGSHISSPVLGLLPESRGSISLASSNPEADPIIDPNYLGNERDKEVLRAGIRLVLRTILDTDVGKATVEGETPPPGFPPLSISSSDQEIDYRIANIGRSFYQCAGTAAMGSVVDTKLQVKGVHHLRVIDASILPVPLAGHNQCPIYAIIAESAADLLLEPQCSIVRS